jgi:hypothetical protein
MTKAKNGWGVAQMIDHLPNKFRALNSNPSTAIKEKKRNQYLAQDMHVATKVPLVLDPLS